MSWKASKAQIVDPVFANKFINGTVTFQTTFLFIMMFIQMFFAVYSEALICANLENEILIEFPFGKRIRFCAPLGGLSEDLLESDVQNDIANDNNFCSVNLG